MAANPGPRKKTPHNGFAVVALSSVLLDALSQYNAGIEQSDGEELRKFVRLRLPSGTGKLPASIRLWNEKSGKERQANDLANVSPQPLNQFAASRSTAAVNPI